MTKIHRRFAWKKGLPKGPFFIVDLLSPLRDRGNRPDTEVKPEDPTTSPPENQPPTMAS